MKNLPVPLARTTFLPQWAWTNLASSGRRWNRDNGAKLHGWATLDLAGEPWNRPKHA